MNVESAIQGETIGIIVPPPDIKAIVNKTAQFVARNGKSFEERILASDEGKSSKFNFLKAIDPYYAYYEQQIAYFERLNRGEEIENLGQQKDENEEQKQENDHNMIVEEIKEEISQDNKQKERAIYSNSNSEDIIQKESNMNPLIEYLRNKSEERPVNLELLVKEPNEIDAMQADIIKLTSQFTATGGREFLTGLAQTESGNDMFGFINPTHRYFSYFRNMVDVYAKMIQPPEEQKLFVTMNTNRHGALTNITNKWMWKQADEEKKRNAALIESERFADLGIDWHDFIVVETIDLEDFPKPILEYDMDHQIYASRLEEAQVQALNNYTEEDDSEEEDDDEEEIKVISNEEHAANKSKRKALAMIDPVSGKAVPVEEISEHLRVQLLDPRWREQQKRFEEKNKDTGIAAGASIADSLKNFAQQRSDIFGDGTINAKLKTSATSDYTEEEAIVEPVPKNTQV